MELIAGNSDSSFSYSVEQERAELLSLKKSGKFNVYKHLDNHPVGGIVNKGACLSKEHPLMRVLSRK